MQRSRAAHPRAVALAGALAAGLAPAPALAAGGLNIMPDWTGLLPVMIVLFVVLIFPVSNLVVKPMLRVLDERRERIQGRRERSRKIRAEAQVVQERYEEAVSGAREAAQSARREVLDGARSDQTRLTGAARAKAEAKVSAARIEVAKAVDAARQELLQEADALAQDAASRVLGRPLS